ncbi:unnamed protein product [Somion occarium]|uniref:Uncharacterized protein n=1 Tax=Somion occarium TaxID=3059160 RepID=A0ABP1DIZ2_9APHY
MRFSIAATLAAVAASSVPAFSAPLEVRAFRHKLSKPGHMKDIGERLPSLGGNIDELPINSRDMFDLDARNELEHTNDIFGIPGDVTATDLTADGPGAIYQRRVSIFNQPKSCDGCVQMPTNLITQLLSTRSDLEARKVRNVGNKLEHANNIVGITDGLTGIATNIAYAAQRRRDLTSRRVKLEQLNHAAGIADGLTSIATNIASAALQRRDLEARKVTHAGNKLEHVNNIVGIADGLTGIATNIAGAVEQRSPLTRSDLESRRIGRVGNKLEHANNIVGIADGLTGIATNIAGAAQQRRDLDTRRVKLQHVDDAVGIVDGLTSIATNIAGAVQQRSLEELD